MTEERRFIFDPQFHHFCKFCGFPHYDWKEDNCPICHHRKEDMKVGNFKCPKHPEYNFWEHIKSCPICAGIQYAKDNPPKTITAEDLANREASDVPLIFSYSNPNAGKRDRKPRGPVANKRPPRKQPTGPKKKTKTALLREAFAEQPTWAQDDLLTKTGYDARNLNTALAIMRNPKRTKPDLILEVKFDRAAKTYTLQEGK